MFLYVNKVLPKAFKRKEYDDIKKLIASKESRTFEQKKITDKQKDGMH